MRLPMERCAPLDTRNMCLAASVVLLHCSRGTLSGACASTHVAPRAPHSRCSGMLMGEAGSGAEEGEEAEAAGLERCDAASSVAKVEAVHGAGWLGRAGMAMRLL